MLRLGPVERQRLLGFERGLMRAEERVCAVCRSLDLPCSRVLAVDCSRALVDRDYMIVDYIPSVPMCDAGLGRGEKERLYHELGRWLRRLHSVRGEGFGFVSRQLEGREEEGEYVLTATYLVVRDIARQEPIYTEEEEKKT